MLEDSSHGVYVKHFSGCGNVARCADSHMKKDERPGIPVIRDKNVHLSLANISVSCDR